MKKYYVRYYKDFSNTYDLRYTETPEEELAAKQKGYERIPRKEAERLCSAENYRRKHDEAFSGYADNVILPFSYPDDRDWRNDRRMYLDGYIVCRGGALNRGMF